MNVLSIPEYAPLLQKDTLNIWRAQSTSQISYPEEGNTICWDLEAKSSWFKHRNNCINQAVNNFKPTGPIFDIGGGNGYVSAGLKENGFDTVLVEPGEVGARNAKKRGLENIVCATFQDANFKDHSLDAIGLFDTLEHIENSVEFLMQLRQKLKQSAFLYITVPAFPFLWSGEDVFAGHFRRYTCASLTQELVQAGFSVSYCSYIFSALVLPLFLLRSLPFRLFGNPTNELDMEKASREHALGKGIIHSCIEASFAWELSRLAHNQQIPFGTSCLAIARA